MLSMPKPTWCARQFLQFRGEVSARGAAAIETGWNAACAPARPFAISYKLS